MPLVEQLNTLRADFRRHVHEDAGYSLSYWPIRISARMTAMRITQVFMTFCIVTFLLGTAATFVSATKELGIALVVGAIFTGGSFVIQYWSIQMTKEDAYSKRLGDAFGQEQELQKILREISAVAQEIQDVDPDYFRRSKA